MPERIGVFGGTFDPPHVGHLVTAVNVRHGLRLDRVLLVVANVPWQKEGSRAISDGEDRFALVEEAVDGVRGLEASHVELDRGGPSYTADTLAVLAERHPGAGLFTILGEDAAAAFLTWERHGEVAARSTLVVVERPGCVADCRAASTGCGSRSPTWRCRAPTCGRGSSTGARSSTCRRRRSSRRSASASSTAWPHDRR